MVGRCRKKISGTTTIEASLIFPFIFLSFVALIFLCIILYQQTAIKSIAQSLSQKGELISQEEMKNYKDQGVEVSTKIKSTVFQKEIIVEVQTSYPIPLGGLLRRFGLSENYVIKETLETKLQDPVEFVRITDFGVETIKDIDGLTEGKISGVVGNITEKLRKFF
jgi:hypothetical protein